MNFSGIDTTINSALEPLANSISKIVFFELNLINGISIPFLVIWLILGSLIFTIYLNFVNFTGLKHTWDVLGGKYRSINSEGEINSFQALTTAISGTVGLGNIAGVGVAIATGGPGAAVWMTLAGFLGMSSKFLEASLGMIYRKRSKTGELIGGPMFYLSRGLKEYRKLPLVGSILSVLYCIMCICGVLGGGNMLQANQSYQQLVNVTGGIEHSYFADKAWLFGLVLAIFVGFVIIGGLSKIAKVTEKLVPMMGLIFIGSGLIIIFVHLNDLPEAIMLMLRDAFTARGVTGGIIGSMIVGLRRSAFSSEVGVGFTAIAHAPVKNDKPVSEGFVSMLEPFIDTVVVCNTTALVIVITKTYLQTELDGVTLTSTAFASVMPWFPYVLTLAVLMFAFSTLISYSYYGLRAWCYLFGDNSIISLSFKIIFLLCIIIGSTMDLRAVINFSDAMFFAMTFINFSGIYLLAPLIKSELNKFKAEYVLNR